MKFLSSIFLFSVPFLLLAQSPIITAFPSLRIPSSSRGLSMGDCGVASAEGNQQLWYNQAKTAFTHNSHQLGVSYTPWMAAVSNDTRFMNLNYVGSLSEGTTLGLSLSYLRLGNVSIRDNNGAMIGSYNSNEYNLYSGIALQLSDNASVGVGLRFLSSQPGPSYDPVSNSAMLKQTFSASADISFYQNFSFSDAGKLEWGLCLTNLGPKLNLEGSGGKTFLPTNLGIGISYTNALAENTNLLTWALDANKLLVPSPPSLDANGNILFGKDPDRSVLNALFSSFSDAPRGMGEELREIRVSCGTEFAFSDVFFLRSGISLENRMKGNRKFIGFGVGYKGLISDQSWAIDFHYLVPLYSVTATSPFQNCWGFTLGFNFGSTE
jgi:hypothetical protein